MSKSTLSITVSTPPESSRTGMTTFRTVEIPCRLPEAFDFSIHAPGHGVVKCTAYLAGFNVPREATVGDVEAEGYSGFDLSHLMDAGAQAILADAKRRLGLLSMEGRGDALATIALAYEAEVASHFAQFKALQALPRALQSPGLVSTHPSERETYAGGAVGMLAKYVEWVFEQACKAQSERAEAQAKVTT